MLRLFVSLGLVFFAAFNTSAGPAADADHFYVTRDDFEPDKCASIWLIKRFIDPQAVFVIRPAGAPLKPGIPFDVPEAELRRYHNRCRRKFNRCGRPLRHYSGFSRRQFQLQHRLYRCRTERYSRRSQRCSRRQVKRIRLQVDTH